MQIGFRVSPEEPQEAIDAIRCDLAELDDWEDRYRYIIELGQALTPARQPSLLDFSASALGIVSGLALARWIWPRLAARVFGRGAGKPREAVDEAT